MDKILLILVTSLICMTSYGQINIEDLEIVQDLWCEKGKSKPYTGEFIEKHDDKSTKGTGFIKKGLIHGLRLRYFSNGKLSSEKNYDQGVNEGLTKEFYENGILKQEGIFKNGKESGTWIIYYETGEKHVSIDFENGIQHGDYFEYSKEGLVKERAYYSYGKLSISPKFLIHAKEGDRLSGISKYKEAIKSYSKAIEINSSIALVFVNRGACYETMIDFETAIKDYDKAIVLNDQLAVAYGYRGNAKINLFTAKGNIKPSAEESKDACEDLNKAIQLGDTNTVTKTQAEQHCNK